MTSLGGRSDGIIGWFVRNRVTSNLMMVVFIAGGLAMSTQIKQEVFPEFSEDLVTVTIPYPGASSDEVERGIILSVEEVLRSLDGVHEVRATAREGQGTISVELDVNADAQQVYQDIQQEVGRIRTFPEEAEEPQVTLEVRRREVLALQVFGDVEEVVLREYAERVRERLLQEPGISQVELEGVRAPEVRVEISRETLRGYGLTLDEVARRIRLGSVDLPGGVVETEAGELLLRIKERREWAREFARLPIITSANGSILTLADLAQVRDDFEVTNRFATYDNHRSISLEVYRVGEQTPIGVSDAVRRAMESIEEDLPPGVDYAINRDSSNIYRQRLELLLRNAFLGLVLVLLLLGLFLEFRLAFWVTLGIPTAFLGAFLFLPAMGVTINMISMFAFIIALGIVVDDAIVAGENIYENRRRGMSATQAAIQGAREVSLPVAFSILTNIVAFAPLRAMPGMMGKIWDVIPLVVGTVFLVSWIESLIILPVHLAHEGRPGSGVLGALSRAQQAFSRFFERFVEVCFRPFLAMCVKARVLTVAVAFSLLAVVVAYALSGRMGFILMPTVESDRAVATAVLPVGSPIARARDVLERLTQAANKVARAHGGQRLVTGIYASIEENKLEATVYLTPPKIRPITTARFTEIWREELGDVEGLRSLRFESDRGGPGRGAAITIELRHADVTVLDRASSELARELSDFGNVKDVDDGYTPGKTQIDFRMKAEGRSLGFTAQDVGRQVRSAFFGAEALRQQRGRNEVKVMVRLPEHQRVSEYDIEQLLLRTEAGRYVPLSQVAEPARGHADTEIIRRNGHRTVTVTANVEPLSETNQVLQNLELSALPRLVRDYPGLAFGFEGRQADLQESFDGLMRGLGIALLVIYVLLAIPFRSYLQPLIVMVAIPFGVVGAILGHELMGYSLSMISLMGIVALSGVVVNDSLVLIDYANRQRQRGLGAREAILAAGCRRFRPILLTTLTTFGGLAPMIFETSRQARFMIPMAISLGYGILFATAITLVIVPSLYVLVEDFRTLLAGGLSEGAPEEEGSVDSSLKTLAPAKRSS